MTYVIEDGVAWETGRGQYSPNNPNSFRRAQIIASSTGSKLSLTGNATVSLAYLSQDHVADWPYLDVANYNGGDATTTQNGAYFPTLVFGNKDATVDTHGGWDKNTGYYLVPQTGVYDILFKFRLPDGTGAAIGYGMGVDNTNGDSPNFSWFESGYGFRKGAIYRRVTRYNAGDNLRAFTYIDGNVNGYTYASMTIMRVR